MRRVNTKSAGLENHMSNYNRSDARLDHPNLPDRELDKVVHAARMDIPYRYVPLRRRIKVA